jgi:hypothetical protein
MGTIHQASTASLNARVSAVALVVGAIAQIALSSLGHPFTPLRILTIGICTLGVWAFCDEMGMRKPLIRAGFVAFVLAEFSRASALMDPQSPVIGRHYVLYAFAVMIALLLWSVAFLHRQRELKVAGAIGAAATIAPILAMIVGHIALGAGAVFGIGSLMAAADGAQLNDYSFIKALDVLFAIWALVSAWFLWRGHIKAGN